MKQLPKAGTKAATGARGRLKQRIAAIADAIAPARGLRKRVEQQERLFDKDAPNYDGFNSPDMYLSPARLAEILAGQVANLDAPILDLACGTGLAGEKLAELGFRHLTGTDLSAGMLAQAEQKQIYERLIKADLHAGLPLEEGSFDAAICAGGFYDDSLAVQSLSQALPLLRPGGVLVCDIWLDSWRNGGVRPGSRAA